MDDPTGWASSLGQTEQMGEEWECSKTGYFTDTHSFIGGMGHGRANIKKESGVGSARSTMMMKRWAR